MVKSKCEALRDFVWREETFKKGLQSTLVLKTFLKIKLKTLDVSFKERSFTLVHQPAMESC